MGHPIDHSIPLRWVFWTREMRESQDLLIFQFLFRREQDANRKETAKNENKMILESYNETNFDFT